MSAPRPYVERAGSVAPRRPLSCRPSDRGDRLARMLMAHAGRAGCPELLTVATVVPWSSATFSGSVITLRLAAEPGPALTAWLDTLPESDIPLGRDLIADMVAERSQGGWTLRVLLCLDAANG